MNNIIKLYFYRINKNLLYKNLEILDFLMCMIKLKCIEAEKPAEILKNFKYSKTLQANMI